MGTPDFAAASLERTAEAGHEILAAVTGEDKPVGRGNKIQFCAVKQTALKYGIPVLQPQGVRGDEIYETLRELDPEIIIVSAYGHIIPKRILDLPPYGCINVHASLLPAYRGAAPIQWAVIDGQKVSGVTIMQMNEGLDTGDMIARAEVELAPDETGGSLFDRLSSVGAELLTKTLEQIAAGTVDAAPQPAESPTPYARMIRKQDGKIDWTRSAVQIERLIRGLNPWPSAYTELEGRMLKIWSAEVCPSPDAEGSLPGAARQADERVCENSCSEDAAAPQPDGIRENKDSDGAAALRPGTICEVTKSGFSVQTGEGVLRILELQLAGKKRMQAAEFLRGFQLQEGAYL
ncbi:MAG: methionyl-tRNA formyltransferase [Eubacterium sp.]|nr:methionyl-tRNA formyltransferase [Eubacterium sp.]